MKKIIVVFLILLSISSLAFHTTASKKNITLKTGDILFIESSSGQGKAIQLATHSKYTHVGIVVVENGKTTVYHAVEPVMKSSLEEFLNYSSNGQYQVKRLKSGITKSQEEKLIKEAKSMLGRHYDIYFSWGNDELYCTEYIWKLYYTCLGIV